LAFFKKLKDRLFKSSSKIDEGLEAIVGEGDEAEVSAVGETVQDAPAQAVETAVASPDDAAKAEKAALREAEKVAAERKAQIEAHAQAAQLARAAEARAIQQAADEAARQAAEAAALEADAERQAEEERLLEEARKAEDARAKEAARHAAQERQAEEERLAAEQARRDAARKAAQDAEERAAAPEPLRATMTPVAPDLMEDTSSSTAKPGLLGRLMGRAAPQAVPRRALDDEMLEQLEELLITADMGVDTALRVTANMAEGRFGKKLSVAEIKQLMADEIARIMEPVARPLPLYPKTPQVVLVVGVNGSGKTTTIGKLASQFRAAGKKVVIAAGDTFRAAAVEQLQVWGERAGVPVLTAAQGSDPASLAFDAMTQAQADGADLLLIDTAGRLQNRGDLMEELAKIVRVIRKKDAEAPHNTLLVLDATTGQNALNQVKVFQEISDVSGLVMTKLDGTAKGGVLVALADKFGLPIHAIGVGEQIDDLQPFDPQEFADALVGYER
jgi:fused signal recognition particle receptor